MPRNTQIFAPTFDGEGVVRSDDITKDPRYGHNAPHQGMPEGPPAGAQLSGGAGHLAARARCSAACSSAIRSPGGSTSATNSWW